MAKAVVGITKDLRKAKHDLEEKIEGNSELKSEIDEKNERFKIVTLSLSKLGF